MWLSAWLLQQLGHRILTNRSEQQQHGGRRRHRPDRAAVFVGRGLSGVSAGTHTPHFRRRIRAPLYLFPPNQCGASVTLNLNSRCFYGTYRTFVGSYIDELDGGGGGGHHERTNDKKKTTSFFCSGAYADFGVPVVRSPAMRGDIDRWIELVKGCAYLPENELKVLYCPLFLAAARPAAPCPHFMSLCVCFACCSLTAQLFASFRVFWHSHSVRRCVRSCSRRATFARYRRRPPSPATFMDRCRCRHLTPGRHPSCRVSPH